DEVLALARVHRDREAVARLRGSRSLDPPEEVAYPWPTRTAWTTSSGPRRTRTGPTSRPLPASGRPAARPPRSRPPRRPPRRRTSRRRPRRRSDMPRTYESFDKDLAILVSNDDSAVNDAIETIVDDKIEDLDLGGGGACSPPPLPGPLPHRAGAALGLVTS